VECDWLAQIFRLKKGLNLKIFGKFSVHGNFSSVQMGLYSSGWKISQHFRKTHITFLHTVQGWKK
jgi:hypothetical protein